MQLAATASSHEAVKCCCQSSSSPLYKWRSLDPLIVGWRLLCLWTNKQCVSQLHTLHFSQLPGQMFIHVA